MDQEVPDFNSHSYVAFVWWGLMLVLVCATIVWIVWLCVRKGRAVRAVSSTQPSTEAGAAISSDLAATHVNEGAIERTPDGTSGRELVMLTSERPALVGHAVHHVQFVADM